MIATATAIRNKKKLLIASCLILVISIASLLLYQIARPQIETQSVIEYGIVQPASNVPVKLHITNKGMLPLRVSDVVSDCNCTIPSSEELVIKGGETATLEINIVIPSGNESYVFQVLYNTNDSSHPGVKSEIRMQAQYGMEISPKRVLFMHDLFDPAPEEQTIRTMVPEGRPDLKFFKATAQMGYISLITERPNKREALIRVKLKKPIINGEFKSRVYIEYQLEGESPFKEEIMVCGMLNDSIKSNPPIIRMPLSNASAEATLTGIPAGKAEITLVGFKKGRMKAQLLSEGVLSLSAEKLIVERDAGTILLYWPDQDQSLSIPVSIHK